MSKSITTRKRSDRTDWNRIRSMRDDEIDYSDIPKMGEQFFANAVVVQPGTLMAALGSGAKQQITLRIDKEVVTFFKRQGKGYQRLMNFALRAYMLRHNAAEAGTKNKSTKGLKRRTA
jgi:uncharacterized protein (DUF4415 family)